MGRKVRPVAELPPKFTPKPAADAALVDLMVFVEEVRHLNRTSVEMIPLVLQSQWKGDRAFDGRFGKVTVYLTADLAAATGTG